MSKKIYYIDTENLSVEFDKTILQNPDRLNESPISDLIRFSAGKFLTVNNKNLETYSGDKYVSADTVSSSKDTEVIQLKADTRAFSKKIVNSQGLIQDIFDYKKWEKFVLEDIATIYGTSFLDHYTEINNPANLTEISSDPKSSNIFNREFSYRFYSPEYEQLTANQNIDEYVLPNVYDHLQDRRADIDTPNENLRISLGGLIPEYLSQGVLQSTEITDNGKKYFSEFSKKVNSSDANIVVNEIMSMKQPVTYMDDSILNTLTQEIYNNIPFPLSTKIIFKSNIDTSLVREIDEKQLNILLFNSIINSTTPSQFTIPQVRNFYSFEQDTKKLDSKDLTIFDLKRFIQTNTLTSTSGDVSANFDINQNANLLSFVDYIKTNYTSKKRNYNNLTNKAEKGILFYRLSKKPISSKSKAIQYYYLKTNKLDMIKFVDTQIRYDRDYVYELEAATLIVGNKYKYTNDYYRTEEQRNNDLKNGFYRLNVVNATSMQIVFVPVASFTGSVLQAPPTKPAIEIANINRKLSIKVLRSTEIEKEKQEIIEDQDFNKFKRIAQSQDNKDNLITFDNSSETKKIQIYRSILRPKFYSDFNGKLYKTVSISKTLGSFEDEVIPNVEYFYTFRYLNEHDLPSNPTKVYKVALKDEDGLLYLQKEIINLEKELIVANEKSFKRYVYISPSMNQKVVNNDIDALEKRLADSNDASTIDLGVEKSSVWNKQFVMIIRSKDTGRQLKFRFGFDINKEKE